MSPMPQVTPGSTRRLTKNSPSPRIGVGQKSSAVELTGAPRFCGAPQGASVDSRSATQMSMSVRVSPSKRGRVDAMNRLRPSGAWIGQPSWNAVFNSPLVPGTSSALTAGAQGENSIACAAGANAARSASTARTRIAEVIIPLLLDSAIAAPTSADRLRVVTGARATASGDGSACADCHEREKAGCADPGVAPVEATIGSDLDDAGWDGRGVGRTQLLVLLDGRSRDRGRGR